MFESLSDLPDDIASRRAIIAAQVAELKDRPLEGKRLKIQLARLKRMAFGREVAFWAHVRRKIHDVHLVPSAPLARDAQERIGGLFDVERAVMGKPPDTRRAARHEKSLPVLGDLRAFFESSSRRLPDKGKLAETTPYALNRWEALIRHAEDGRCEIIDNAPERRAILPLPLGRKNGLLSAPRSLRSDGSDAGGHRAAALYSLIETAKLDGIEPRAYLTTVLERITDHPINRIDDLLPWGKTFQ